MATSDSHPGTPNGAPSQSSAEEDLQLIIKACLQQHHSLKRYKSRRQREALAEQMLSYKRGDDTFLDSLQEKLRLYSVRLPTVTIVFKNLVVSTPAMVGSAGVETVGNVPINFSKRVVGLGGAERVELAILNNLSGVLQPGTLTLLLGPPSCGKSTFLKLLAGRLKRSRGTKITGELTYNNQTAKQFCVQQTVGFVNQMDNHNPNLTVRETLEFAYRCQWGLHGTDFDMPVELLKARSQKLKLQSTRAHTFNVDPSVNETVLAHNSSSPAKPGLSPTLNGSLKIPHSELLDDFERLFLETWGTGAKTEVVLRLTGLWHCRDTPVGGGMMRGISGGERKRLTTAEVLVGPRRVLMMDEISTGLDSATLFSIIKWLGKMTQTMQLTTLITLLQPPPETYNLFDDVMLISEGQITYQGPVGSVLDYFNKIGLICPERKDVPSFLLEVTTRVGQLEYASNELKTGKNMLKDESTDERGKVKSKALLVGLDEMRQVFWEQTEQGHRLKAILDGPPPVDEPPALSHSGYSLSPMEAIAVVTARQLKLVMRDKVLVKARTVQITVISLIAGSLFYNLEENYSDARTFFGAAFMGLLLISFGGFPQIPITLEAKKVFFKQRDDLFYSAMAQGVSMLLSQLPLTLLESTIFSLVMYFMVGYWVAPGYFFTFYVIIISASLCMTALFRFIACISKDQVYANAIAGIIFVILIVTSGFTIVRQNIPGWMIWAYYISPFAYALRSIVINEMTAPPWRVPSTFDPSVSEGDAALLSFGFFTERAWIWIGVGFLMGACLLLTALSILALHLLNPPTPQPRLPDAAEMAKARAEQAERRLALVKMQAKIKSSINQSKGVDGGFNMVTAIKSTNSTADITIASSLPFTPVTLVFSDLRYHVPNPSYSRSAARAAAKSKQEAAGKAAHDVEAGEQDQLQGEGDGDPEAPTDVPKQLTLLHGITGFNEPGVLMALMGGSGAGKTTLMDVLACRKTIGEVEGSIWVNGRPPEMESWHRLLGYVEQSDVHSGGATVYEALWFSARLRLPGSIHNKEVRAYVDEVMDIVDLMDIMFNLVGTPGESGLSVEQRKRLTIAVELVANPSIVFMDEPTSGLDARAAVTVMQAIRNVSRNGRTVMVTIHQPSIEIFESFDTLMLIQRGGRTTYFGPLGYHSSSLQEYLTAVPGTPPLPAGFNPATWMLEVTGGSMATMVKAHVDVDWPALYSGSSLAAANNERVKELVGAEHQQPIKVDSMYATSFSTQCQELTVKFFDLYWRSPGYNLTRLFLTTFSSLLYGVTFWNVGQVPNPASIGSVQNVMGIMFSSSNFLGMTNLMSAMPVVGAERIVFYREQGAAMYNPFAFGFAVALVEMPYLLVQSVLYVGITYFMINFAHDPSKFFYYLLMFFLTLSFYTIFGQFLVYVTPNMAIAQVLGAALNFNFNIFNGFVITYPAMPEGWRWMNRIAPPTWILYGLGVSQLGDVTTPIIYGSQQKTTAQFMTEMFGYDVGMMWWCILILTAYILFFRTTSILALRYFNFLRR